MKLHLITDDTIKSNLTKDEVRDEIAAGIELEKPVDGWTLIRGEIVPLTIHRGPQIVIGEASPTAKPGKPGKPAPAPQGVRLKKDGTPARKPGRKPKAASGAASGTASGTSNGASVSPPSPVASA